MENQKYPENLENRTKKSPSGFMLFEIGIEFAIMIGLPLYLFIQLGKWLDRKYSTNFIVLISIFAALALTSYMVYKKINSYKNFTK